MGKKIKPKYSGYLKREMGRYVRTILFTPEDKEKFDIIYTGAVNTNKEFPNRSERRVYGKVLSKLESIAVSSEENGVITFKLQNVTDVNINFEDAEFNLLIAALDAVSWRATAVRKIDTAIDWLEGFPKT